MRFDSFSCQRAIVAAGSGSPLGGLLAQGGSFILIPLMTSFMQILTRIAIGSNLAIILLSALAAFWGKTLTGQILWLLTLQKFDKYGRVVPAVLIRNHM